MDGIQRQLCAVAADARERPATEAQRSALKLRLIDTIGCGVGASTAASVRQTCDAVLKLGGSGPCTVFGRGKAPVDRATFLNGFMQRYLDFNDVFLGEAIMSHPSDTIAAALAVGEAEHRSGEEVLRAIAAGYNVYCSFCDVANTYTRGWDLGLLAVPVAIEAGILLKLSDEQMAHAISLAVVPQIPLRQTRLGSLSQWKGAASAHASASAVFAAYLAAAGMSGPDAPFEGKLGVIALVTGPMTPRLEPRRDRTAESSIKLAPAGQHGQGPVQLGVELRARLGDCEPGDAAAVLARVDEIELRTYKAALVAFADAPEKWEPENHETADHSLPFLFALALAYGHVDERDIDRGIHDPAVRELTRRVRVSEDPAFTARYGEEAPVQVRLRGAQGTIEGTLDTPLGSLSRPVPLERVLQKFHTNADRAIGRARADDLEARLLAFERLPDVAGLLEV